MGAPEGGPIGVTIGSGLGYVGGNLLACRYLDGVNQAYVFPWIMEYIP